MPSYTFETLIKTHATGYLLPKAAGALGGGTGNGTTKKSASLDAPGSIVECEDGQQYKVTYDEDGNKTYRLLSNAGDGNVQKKKASRTETVEVVGDQNLLAQRGGAQQDGGQLPPGVVEL